MTNPFQYGSVVLGDAFCNRSAELRDLRRAVEDSAKLFVYSERRLGKTSLVRSVLDRLPSKRFAGIYVDLKPFSSTFTRHHGLRSASNSQRAAQALVERDIIDPANRSFVISDRFLQLWIREMQAETGQVL